MVFIFFVFWQLGLAKVADTTIGSAAGGRRGISGGEAKRLSFASEVNRRVSLAVVFRDDVQKMNGRFGRAVQSAIIFYRSPRVTNACETYRNYKGVFFFSVTLEKRCRDLPLNMTDPNLLLYMSYFTLIFGLCSATFSITWFTFVRGRRQLPAFCFKRTMFV